MRNRQKLCLKLSQIALLGVPLAFVSSDTGAPGAAQTIKRTILGKWLAGLEARDLRRIRGLYDESGDLFLIAPGGKVYEGPCGLEERYQAVLETVAEVASELHVERLTVWQRLAMCCFWGSWKVRAAGKGTPKMEIFQVTWVLENKSGKWQIVHEHMSTHTQKDNGMPPGADSQGNHSLLSKLAFKKPQLPPGSLPEKLRGTCFHAKTNPFLSKERRFINSFVRAFFLGFVSPESVKEALYSVYREKVQTGIGGEIGIFGFSFRRAEEAKRAELFVASVREPKVKYWRRGKVLVVLWHEHVSEHQLVKRFEQKICRIIQERRQ